MNYVLIDTSVWISFFKGSSSAKVLFPLLESNQVCVNDLILAELIPLLNHKKEDHLIDIFHSVENIELKINWSQIIQMQTMNLRNGLNKVGISDLIIAQNAIDHQIPLLSFDKHFKLMSGSIGLQLFNN